MIGGFLEGLGMEPVFQLPVGKRPQPVSVKCAAVTGFQLMNIAEDAAARRTSGTDKQQIDDAFPVDDRFDIRVFQQCFDFGAENKSIVFQSVKELIDSHAVTGKKKPLTRFLPDGESENSVEAVEAFLYPVDI